MRRLRTEIEAGERSLMAHAADHAGLFTEADAAEHGLDRHWLHRAHRSGRVQRVYSRTYRVSGAPTGSAVDLAAVQASSERELLVSHGSAAALQGFPGFALVVPHELLVCGTTAISRDGCRIHRTRVLDPRDIGEAGGLPATSHERTLVDVAGRLDAAAATSLVDFLVSSKAGERQPTRDPVQPLASSPGGRLRARPSGSAPGWSAGPAPSTPRRGSRRASGTSTSTT